jgi:16S rRNA (guanine527-N7)-methyltransferase
MYCATADVTLIESQGKKAAFLNEVIYALKLKNARVFHGRAEQFSSRADLVTLRAVEEFDKALPTASGLVKLGGRIALMIGRSQAERARQAAQNLEWSVPVNVPGGESRLLLTGTKIVNVE